jgi:hypothetical protein
MVGPSDVSSLINTKQAMWYSAKLLFEILVDDDQSTPPSCDESIILIEASSETEARELAVKVAEDQQVDYLNFEGNRVSWIFRQLLELQDLREEALYSGVEVFSTRYEPQDNASDS